MSQGLSLSKKPLQKLRDMYALSGMGDHSGQQVGRSLGGTNDLLPAAFGSVQVYKFRSLNSICTSCPYPVVTDNVKALPAGQEGACIAIVATANCFVSMLQAMAIANCQVNFSSKVSMNRSLLTDQGLSQCVNRCACF